MYFSARYLIFGENIQHLLPHVRQSIGLLLSK